MTGAPPSEAPFTQLKVIEVLVLDSTVSFKEVGGSGLVRITAAKPSSEIAELPKILNPRIFA